MAILKRQAPSAGLPGAAAIAIGAKHPGYCAAAATSGRKRRRNSGNLRVSDCTDNRYGESKKRRAKDIAESFDFSATYVPPKIGDISIDADPCRARDARMHKWVSDERQGFVRFGVKREGFRLSGLWASLAIRGPPRRASWARRLVHAHKASRYPWPSEFPKTAGQRDD